MKVSWVIGIFMVRVKKRSAVIVGGRRCCEWGWMFSAQLRGAMHDMKDADNVCERLCWVMPDGVVNGSLVNRFCIGTWLKHKLGKGMA